MAEIRTADSFLDRHSAARRLEKLEAELRAAQAQSADVQAVKEVLGTLALAVDKAEPPTWLVDAPKHTGSHGVPTLFLSDLHWYEVVDPKQIGGVNKFNAQIGRDRLKFVIETAIRLCGLLDSTYNYPGLVVNLGGDNISGDIHEELTATNELPTMPAVVDIYEHLVAALTALKGRFGKLWVNCVTGNHGRNTRKIWSKDRHATSFDWLIYQFLAKRFASDADIGFYVPDGPDALYRVYNTRYLLTHGDKLGHGGDGLIGFLGPVLRGDHKRRTRQQQVNQPYDVMCAGHWHQYAHMSRVIVNGSLKGYDEYAFTEAFPFEPAQQSLWVTHPTVGVNWRMPVLCEEPKKGQPKTDWISVLR